MERYYKYIYIIIFSVILVSFIVYFTGKSKDEKAKISIKKNSLVIENFELSKNVNDSGDYYIIKAKEASYSVNKKSVNMINCDISYFTKNNLLKFRADNCKYELDKKIILNNNIKGEFNKYKFKTSSDGFLEYDMKTEKAKILHGVKVEYINQSIKSDILYIDKKNEIIIFKSNVEAVYELS